MNRVCTVIRSCRTSTAPGSLSLAALTATALALTALARTASAAPEPVGPVGPKPAQTMMMMTRKPDLSVTQKPLWASQPDIAAFEKIDADHLAAAQRSIDAIAAVKGPHTIDNTLRPLDDATREIDSAIYFASLMQAVHPDAKFRDHATATLRKASAAQTRLSLNRDIYRALAAVSLDGADAATQYYVRRQLLEFRLAGVDKDDAARAKLQELNDRLTAETSAFDRNINDGTKTIEVRDASELKGLPQDYIDAHKPKDGVIHLTTDYPDALPILTFAADDDLRRRMLLAFDTRAYPKNREVLKSILETRYQIANLLGYKTWADYNAADKMIRNGAAIGKFIDALEAAVRPTMDKEFQMLLAEKKKTQPQASTIGTWEWSYYEELVRRSSFDFDSQSVRPYFPYQQVKQGILDTASKLFHVTFRREENVPAWDPLVETWLVLDGPKVIGRIYLDMHPRPGKYSHAEMAAVLDGQEGRQLPEAVLICNFPRPTATDPGLMEYGEVQSFFHEFGHLMHMIIGGHQAWAGISGITMEADFAEAPSQMLEELIASPQVLAGFARDYKTGKPIPTDLVLRMRRAAAFGRAIFVALQDGYSALSYDIYDRNPKSVDFDAIAAHDTLKYTPFTLLPGAHMYASFGHLAGYSSAYYTYMWDKVIAVDFFAQFDPKNPLAGDAPMRYRRTVLEPGGSMSANDLVKSFLGRPQSMEALKRWVGQEFQPTG
ncbi:MAG TPA: M3 family metallopeptidase [Steroidobacteraceae bacterium]|jgi:thimet oligopeptidase|nr:M3 family metallopeptidase [Steroidobacteraceae bacterium]